MPVQRQCRRDVGTAGPGSGVVSGGSGYISALVDQFTQYVPESGYRCSLASASVRTKSYTFSVSLLSRQVLASDGQIFIFLLSLNVSLKKGGSIYLYITFEVIFFIPVFNIMRVNPISKWPEC